MERLTDNDTNFGPFTFCRWKNTFSIGIYSGYEEDADSSIRIVAFGYGLRCKIPRFFIRPYAEKKISRLPDSTNPVWYQLHRREFSISLSDMGNGYDFLQLHFGAQTGDSRTEKSWCKHLPWKQWRQTRWSFFDTSGHQFESRPRKRGDFTEFLRIKEECPKSRFEFEDFDGKRIIATCMVEETEWQRGEGWFKWLGWFFRAKVRRSLDIWFSEEVGPEKGSWKGGTVGHGTEMKPGETAQQAFERYCNEEKRGRGGTKYTLKFIQRLENAECAVVSKKEAS